MNHLFTAVAVLLGGWSLLDNVATGQPLAVSGRPSESIELLDGRKYHGLIESEDGVWVRLIQVVQRNGQPTHLVIRSLDRSSVAAVVRLEPAQREPLRRRIERFRNRARIQGGRLEAIRLGLVHKFGSHYHTYRGKWFHLESSADEATTRRVIVQIEQIFTAYRQILPPRTESPRPLRLVVLGSMEEYRAYLRRLGLEIDNPACFILEDNLVVAGSELARLAADLAEVEAEHDRLRKELAALEKRLAEQLAADARALRRAGVPAEEIAKLLRMKGGKIRPEIAKRQRELKRADRVNAQTFNAATRAMFARLYHEAFHAYLENYVYPHKTCDVPRWLNEGLAVMFEGGLLEGDMLRVDAPNRTALERLKKDLAGGNPLTLQQLLAADAQAFVRAHDAASTDARRYYVYAWGLAYYLSLERRLLGSPALDAYVRPYDKRVSAEKRFEELVGTPIGEFERNWRQYIANLR